MLVQLSLSCNGPLNTFTRNDLYKNFIDEIFIRENDKSVRKAIPPEKRMEFMKNISWYFWTDGGKSSFEINDIPEYIFQSHQQERTKESALKRELLVGSLMERKGHEQFYFVHRSFQEFLVAEYIISRNWAKNDLKELSQALNT